ncbi:MAG: flagellar hook-basal body complex protein FliE [Burkholderiaceae bacterium]
MKADFDMDASSLSQLRAALQAAAARREGQTNGAAAGGAGDFGAALDSALKQVGKTEAQAQELQKAFVAGADNVSLEQTMIAVQKSQLAFQATLTVRNRLVSAYTDIMNMQV